VLNKEGRSVLHGEKVKDTTKNIDFFCIQQKEEIEGNVGPAVDISFLSLLIFSDPIEIRLGSVSV
jgi:hypothetical protein